jgi:Fe2+ transport system protein FeoA
VDCVTGVVPLEFLAPGERGRILSVEGNLQAITRLREMGLREGVEVRKIRTGPPCIIAIDEQRLSFRGEDAALVLVEPLVASAESQPE